MRIIFYLKQQRQRQNPHTEMWTRWYHILVSLISQMCHFSFLKNLWRSRWWGIWKKQSKAKQNKAWLRCFSFQGSEVEALCVNPKQRSMIHHYKCSEFWIAIVQQLPEINFILLLTGLPSCHLFFYFSFWLMITFYKVLLNSNLNVQFNIFDICRKLLNYHHSQVNVCPLLPKARVYVW